MDQAAASALEKATREQSNLPAWFSARRLRIAATSIKASICRQKQDVSKLLHRMLHSSFLGSAATRYGGGQEEQATEDYLVTVNTDHTHVTVRRSGLVVHPDEPWLACSPDGIICSSSHDEGLLEVKCPFHCLSMSLDEAARSSSFCLKHDNQSFTLRQSHAYYYQVRHSLLVTGLRWADFVVWSPQELFIERITANDTLHNRMLDQLRIFLQAAPPPCPLC